MILSSSRLCVAIIVVHIEKKNEKKNNNNKKRKTLSLGKNLLRKFCHNAAVLVGFLFLLARTSRRSCKKLQLASCLAL